MKSKKRTSSPFPNTKAHRDIIKKLSDAKYEGTLYFDPKDPNATEVDKAKYELCKLMILHKREYELSQKQIAKKLGIDEARVSEMMHYRFQGYSLERLFDYAKALSPGIKLQILRAA